MSREKTSEGSTGNIHVDGMLEKLKTENNYKVFDKVTFILTRLNDRKRIKNKVYEEDLRRATNIALQNKQK